MSNTAQESRSPIKRKFIAFLDEQPDWAVGVYLNHSLRLAAGIPAPLSNQMFLGEMAAAEAAQP